MSARRTAAEAAEMSDKQLVRYAAQFRKGLLGKDHSGGKCFIVCAPLQSLLRMCGMQLELVESDAGHCNHYWLRLKDGRVLDPTADQFAPIFGGGMPPVYLGEPLKIHRTILRVEK